MPLAGFVLAVQVDRVWLRGRIDSGKEFVRFAPYPDFVTASRIDDKIEMLSEQNNVYRTLASTFLCLTLLGLADWLLATLPALNAYRVQVAVLLLLALFIWSYRKQTNYVAARVKTALGSKPTGKATDSRSKQ